MNSAIEAMLSKYNIQNNEDRQNAIKEILQEITLAGLSRGGFFEKAAFYGGTCLRIFYGLDRFSEDLDFALINRDDTFDISKYFPYVKEEFSTYGINVDIDAKNKDISTDVQSAFIKTNTLILMMTFFPTDEDSKNFPDQQKIKIKFEIDTDNPSGGIIRTKFQMLPAPYELKIFDESTLFAGKIHAILCRNYANNVKGRDYYDYLFYIARGFSFNLKYLENKLRNTGFYKENEPLTLEKIKRMLKQKFELTNYTMAKNDVMPFIKNKRSIDIWCKELFESTLVSLKAS